MVNYGVSRGCRTCKQRHKKCDELRPSCTRCSKSRRPCSYDYGSDSDLVFRHFGSKLSLQHHASSENRDNNDSRIQIHDRTSNGTAFQVSDELQPLKDYSDLLDDFLRGFCIVPKDRSLSRGYLDGLPNLLQQAGHDSDLAKAANVAALGSAGMRLGRKELLIAAEELYAKLLRSFRQTIAGLQNSLSTTTFMTSVLLGLYEIIAATNTSPSAHNAHLQGLSAILTAAGSPFDLVGGLQIFSMANALRVKLPLQNSASLQVLCEPFSNSSVQDLDSTIIKINPVLRRSEEVLAHTSENAEILRNYFAELETIAQELENWASTQLEKWQPQKLKHNTISSATRSCCSGRLELWSEHIEVFYDLYVASVWNTYRKCHILILNMQTRCAQQLQDMLAGSTETSIQKQARWQLKACALAAAILSTVAFNLTDLSTIDGTSSAVPKDVDVKLDKVGRPVGGLLFMHPLYTVVRMAIIGEEIKSYAKKILGWIATEMGIGEAMVLSNADSQLPFMYAARGHILIWAGMLIQSV